MNVVSANGKYSYEELKSLYEEASDARKDYSKIARKRPLSIDEVKELKSINELAIKIHMEIMLYENDLNKESPTVRKKGFYKNEPDSHEICSVCDASPESDEAITDDNWETCWGRNMFFCPKHRIQHPCHNDACEADVCNNVHQEPDWAQNIETWDYDNETYE